MKSHAQAVVIGGGLVGCSILYHLTKLGWQDVVLLERDETAKLTFVADNPGDWLFHCHILEHMEAGRNAVFRVA